MKGNELQKIINSSSETPLLIIDFNVSLWNIIGWWDNNNYSYIFKNNREEILKLSIAKTFNLPSPVQGLLQRDFRVIVIADKYSVFEDGSTGYWRHYEISKDRRVEEAWNKFNPKKDTRTYKGGRKDKSEFFWYTHSLAKEYCERFLTFYEFDGFEADDIASAIYRDERVRNNPRVKIFNTIDRDWNQLVDQQRGFFWLTSRIPRERELIQDRIANDDDIKFYCEKKLGMKISHPSEMILAKVENGDLGDNLPPGTPREYMDLTQPHKKYNLSNHPKYSSLITDCLDRESNNNLDHVDKSNEFFKKLNLREIVRP